MLGKDDRKKKYLLQYGSLFILHMAIQKYRAGQSRPRDRTVCQTGR